MATRIGKLCTTSVPASRDSFYTYHVTDSGFQSRLMFSNLHNLGLMGRLRFPLLPDICRELPHPGLVHSKYDNDRRTGYGGIDTLRRQRVPEFYREPCPRHVCPRTSVPPAATTLRRYTGSVNPVVWPVIAFAMSMQVVPHHMLAFSVGSVLHTVSRVRPERMSWRDKAYYMFYFVFLVLCRASRQEELHKSLDQRAPNEQGRFGAGQENV